MAYRGILSDLLLFFLRVRIIVINRICSNSVDQLYPVGFHLGMLPLLPYSNLDGSR